MVPRYAYGTRATVRLPYRPDFHFSFLFFQFYKYFRFQTRDVHVCASPGRPRAEFCSTVNAQGQGSSLSIFQASTPSPAPWPCALRLECGDVRLRPAPWTLEPGRWSVVRGGCPGTWSVVVVCLTWPPHALVAAASPDLSRFCAPRGPAPRSCHVS